MSLIDLLLTLEPKTSSVYGNLLLFSDIFDACKIRGQDNHHLIEAQLIELEKQGLLTIIYDQNEVVIGVKTQ